jgi:hypothetical protein
VVLGLGQGTRDTSPLTIALPVPLVPSHKPASILQRRDMSLRLSGITLAEQHWMDNESIVIKLAEVETSSRHRRVLLTREVIELAQHGRSGGVQCAAKGRTICLVGMTREDPDDPIPVACHDRLQSSHIAKDERWVVVRWPRQATGMVEHDQIPPRGRRLKFVLQPSELRRAQ